MMHEKSEIKEEYEKMFEEIVSELVCPLSQQIFIDPVTVQTGHVYERRDIQAFFAKGQIKNPLTNLPLRSPALIPAINIKNIIQKVPDLKKRVKKVVRNLQQVLKVAQQMWNNETPNQIQQIEKQKQEIQQRNRRLKTEMIDREAEQRQFRLKTAYETEKLREDLQIEYINKIKQLKRDLEWQQKYNDSVMLNLNNKINQLQNENFQLKNKIDFYKGRKIDQIVPNQPHKSNQPEQQQVNPELNMGFYLPPSSPLFSKSNHDFYKKAPLSSSRKMRQQNSGSNQRSRSDKKKKGIQLSKIAEFPIKKMNELIKTQKKGVRVGNYTNIDIRMQGDSKHIKRPSIDLPKNMYPGSNKKPVLLEDRSMQLRNKNKESKDKIIPSKKELLYNVKKKPY